MARPRIPIVVETKVLLTSRRRCCICFGLNRDNRIKQGQLAHLDHEPTNNDIENLAFLCFDHHDQYDSRTSQSKKITIEEVKAYKKELESHVIEIWSKPIVENGEIKVDIYSGCYVTGNEFAGAELNVKYLGGNLVLIAGTALYNKTSGCPSIGQLDFVSKITDINKAQFVDTSFDYRLDLTFMRNKLITVEKYVQSYFGHNARFRGEYNRLL